MAMWRTCVAAIAGVSLASCGTDRRTQLESIAKDWCETIRASQVIPVYPLTEDLQPGDIFLVQLPVDRQQEQYRKKGFLPLDNHLARLDPGEENYENFYDHSFYAKGQKPYLPREWVRPGGSSTNAWQSAPGAAFPTYAFSVNKSQGINLAIPISGVPVGLSLLGTQSANGTVSIKDARTLGIDTISMHAEMEKWAEENRAFLAAFGDDSPKPRNYVRVITRVYATGKVSVQLNDARSVGGGVDAGMARPVQLFLPRTPTGIGDTNAAAQESFLRGVGRMGQPLNSPEAPTHSAGDDANLSSIELEARNKARAEARTKEIQDREKEAGEQQNAVDAAKTEAEPERRALEEKRKKRKEEFTDPIASLEAELKLLREKQPPPSDADIKAKEQQITDKRKNLEIFDKDELKPAEDAYNEELKKVAAAQGKLDVTKSALDRLTTFAPGGSFRFVSASARSVSMEEKFEPPLIIGYLGFDMAIGPRGLLGPPIPTHALLTSGAGFAQSPEVLAARDIYEPAALQSLFEVLDAAADNKDRNARVIRDRLNSMRRYIWSHAVKSEAWPSDDTARTMSYEEPLSDSFKEYLEFRENRKIVNRDISNAFAGRLRVHVIDAATDKPVPATPEQVREFMAHVGRFASTPQEEREFQAAVNDLYRYIIKITPAATRQ